MNECRCICPPHYTVQPLGRNHIINSIYWGSPGRTEGQAPWSLEVTNHRPKSSEIGYGAPLVPSILHPGQPRAPEGHLGLTLPALNLQWLSYASAKGNLVRSFTERSEFVFNWAEGYFFFFLPLMHNSSQGKRPKNNESNKVRAPIRLINLRAPLEPNQTKCFSRDQNSLGPKQHGLLGGFRVNFLPQCFVRSQK